MDLEALKKTYQTLQKKAETENTSTFDFTDPKKWLKGNKPEDWLELVDHVKLRVVFPNSYQKHNVLSDLFEQAFKEIDPKANRNNEAYAHLFVKYARLKSKHLSEDAAILFNQARAISRKYAVVHIASAQFELDRGDSDKAKKILQKALVLEAQPISDIQEALKNLTKGETDVYISPVKGPELTELQSCKDSPGNDLSCNMSISIPSCQKTDPNVTSSLLKKPAMRSYRSTPVLDSEKQLKGYKPCLPRRVKRINLPFQLMLEGNEEDLHNSTLDSFKAIDTKPLESHTVNGTVGFSNHAHTSGYLSMTCESTIPMEKEPVKVQENKEPEKPKAVEKEEKVPVPSTPMPQLKMLTVNDKHYAILGIIGKGGSSKVYQCLDGSHKIVAIKCVNLEKTPEKVIEGYKNEIRLLKRLQYCDQVITMYDSEFNAEENKLYVVMESGSEDLASFFTSQMKKKKCLSDNLIRYYWEIMLEAVLALHKEGIIHSDLKPANFLLVGGKLKLIDFGIAKALQQDKTSVILDTQIGTLNYMSPETIMDSCGGEGDQGKPKFKIGVKSDVWSLGCILYNMVYMKTPFQHLKNDFFKLQAIMNPDFPIQYADLPNKHLIDVMKKCLTRDPKSRPTVDELLSHPYLRGTSSKTDSPQVVKSQGNT